MRDVTAFSVILRTLPYNFNPHIPCGMWPEIHTRYQTQQNISIHTSHAGCDMPISASETSWPLFQSTHPMRDVTYHFHRNEHPNKISIHTSHAGCDLWSAIYHIPLVTFQSTHPMRDVTRGLSVCRASPRFQSTHPMRDVTTGFILNSDISTISIHTSHAGCDWWTHSCRLQQAYISIHTSHAGCDRSSPTTRISSCSFQSTHPMRDVTFISGSLVRRPIFQSTHPMRDVTNRQRQRTKRRTISIHTSHAGCDQIQSHKQDYHFHFNPHIPCGMWPFRQSITVR